MSKIIVLEVPDKYNTSARNIVNLVRSQYPDTELRLSTNFNWWKDICYERLPVKLLPISPSKKLLDNVESFIDNMRNPKSIEER